MAAAAHALNPANASSLTKFNKTATVVSRVYQDGTLLHDPITPDLIRVIHQYYTAQVITALQLNQLVTDTHTVREMLGVVATESLAGPAVESVGAAFASYAKAPALSPALEADDDRSKSTPLPKEVTPLSDASVPMGRLIEVTLTNPSNGHQVKVPLLIQMLPYVIPAEIVHHFINFNVLPSLKMRWMQWRAGEISFWKDFVFQADIIANRQKVLKNDQNGALLEFLETQTVKNAQTLAKHATQTTAANIANAVLIFSADSLKRAKATTGVDLSREGDRNRYFANTFAMMIVVVDVAYQQVTFYFNGLPGYSTFHFDQFKSKGKGLDAVDLVKAMNAMAQQRAPRF